MIFEIPSVTRFFLNFEISSLKNQRINLISKLIFAGYNGSKNQVRTRQKIKFVSKSIFFRVCNKLPNWHFKNQAQIDTVKVCIFIVIRKVGNPYLKVSQARDLVRPKYELSVEILKMRLFSGKTPLYNLLSLNILTRVFFKLVQCQPWLNREIWPKGVCFIHT